MIIKIKKVGWLLYIFLDKERMINIIKFEEEILQSEEVSENELYSNIILLGKSEDRESIVKLEHILKIRFKYEYDKRKIPYLTCLALINKGVDGIKVIKDCIMVTSRVTWANVLFNTLLHLSKGLLPRKAVDGFEDFERNIKIHDEIIMASKKYLLDFFYEAKSDYDKFTMITNFFYMESNYVLYNQENQKELIKSFYNLISQTSINISSGMIEEFQELIQQDLREEEYQIFLNEHPVFLNPLAKSIIDKSRLGDDYITDFVIHLINEEYILVEIEKPKDNIFTVNNDFTSKFTHAFGQVLDFINWIEINISYARTKLPGIKSPKGMLIMGRRSSMSEEQKAKLKKYNENSHSIEILTFNDLLLNSERLLKNLLQ
ncbi:Shedu anti-phage system protein SduA domain-containing protein [Clostridium intestinale]|uniref:Shedu anti-phage system protein SduA domain-containing protein n=1 Tax=Clostridium intestinale TaxID=36845 RepID=UPI002DD665AD|nr:Shedu anti-phage system protein SduA domain-containing protein [Clostridium intestinale]WRY49662.1 DUF4263 domain-containing protein [Clostridium intestinale]